MKSVRNTRMFECHGTWWLCSHSTAHTHTLVECDRRSEMTNALRFKQQTDKECELVWCLESLARFPFRDGPINGLVGRTSGKQQTLLKRSEKLLWEFLQRVVFFFAFYFDSLLSNFRLYVHILRLLCLRDALVRSLCCWFGRWCASELCSVIHGRIIQNTNARDTWYDGHLIEENKNNNNNVVSIRSNESMHCAWINHPSWTIHRNRKGWHTFGGSIYMRRSTSCLSLCGVGSNNASHSLSWVFSARNFHTRAEWSGSDSTVRLTHK